MTTTAPVDGGRFDAVVIGSGFGGAVSACRLAQAGLRVCVLERGKRYTDGNFPRSADPAKGWLFHSESRGIIDVKPIATEMLIVQSAGWGGGSLVYENVNIRPPADAFAAGWPEGYDRPSLDPYYDLVAYMLDVKPISASQPKGLAPKTLRMQEAARATGREAQLVHPNLAVDFGDPDAEHPNRFGVMQRGCTHCGECYIGCNQRAKNTLDLNYLTLAERAGATARTDCLVERVEPVGEGWRVTYLDRNDGEVATTVDARWVFVCAGAVNSTELLLRSRDDHGALPHISDRLGHGYSANGDFLAVAYGLRERTLPNTGPGITSALAFRRDGDGGAWILVEDGNGPPLVNLIASLFDPRATAAQDLHVLWDEIPSAMLSIPRPRTDADDRADHSLPLLLMGRDSADGQLYIAKGTGRLHIGWELAKNLALYGLEARLATDIAHALGGAAAYNPLWRILHQPLTVHSLGGCPMADDPSRGVLDGNGEVFGHPGLFVLDGAALPAATGANPSATIAAVAERNIERFIRRATGNATWQAPERALAKPVEEPLDRVVYPPGGSRAPETAPVGVSFRESMSGKLALGHAPPDDYRGGEAAGGDARFDLQIVAFDVDAFLRDIDHTAVAHGTIEIAGLTPEGGTPVTAGVFNLLCPGDRPNERHFRYLLPFYGSDGKPYLLDGHKDLTGDKRRDIWAALSTLYTVVRAGHGRGGEVVATGILRFHLSGIPEMIRSFTATGAPDLPGKAAAELRLGRLVLDQLWDVYGV